MSIDSELTRIENAKASLRSALITQGQSVSVNDTIDDYPTKVINIANADPIIAGTETSITSNALSVRDYAFYYYTTLVSVNFPVATTIGYEPFTGCTSLASASFGSATSIGEALRGKMALTSVSVPELTGIAMDGFNGCTSLANITLPKVSYIDVRGFANCSSLASITLGYCLYDDKEGHNDPNVICTLADSTTTLPLGQHIVVYVPSDLISSYQNAPYWNSLYTNGDVTFQAIS